MTSKEVLRRAPQNAWSTFRFSELLMG